MIQQPDGHAPMAASMVVMHRYAYMFTVALSKHPGFCTGVASSAFLDMHVHIVQLWDAIIHSPKVPS